MLSEILDIKVVNICYFFPNWSLVMILTSNQLNHINEEISSLHWPLKANAQLARTMTTPFTYTTAGVGLLVKLFATGFPTCVSHTKITGSNILYVQTSQTKKKMSVTHSIISAINMWCIHTNHAGMRPFSQPNTQTHKYALTNRHATVCYKNVNQLK